MVLLGLLPVLEAMVCIILIQVKTGESLGVTPITPTINIDREAVYKQALIHISKRVKKEVECPLGYYLHPNETHCCLLCHKGTYVSQHCLNKGTATDCKTCPEGQYLDTVNSSENCRQCSRCRETMKQIVISECTAQQNIVCGCGKNQYRDSTTTEFFCKNCSTCQNGTIVRECTEFQDTKCNCQFGYFLSKNRCLPCDSCNTEECKMGECKVPLGLESKSQESFQSTLVLSVMVVLFAAGCALLLAMKIVKQSYLKRICSYSCLYPPSQQSTTKLATKTPDKASDYLLDSSKKINLYPQKATSVSLPVQGLSHMLSFREMPIPDCPEVLYTVVDHIPFSRWREFIRRLGLKENEIERIDVEQRARREAQYEMLKQWRRQAGHSATLESITTVLNIMELNGCSEDIQDALITFP